MRAEKTLDLKSIRDWPRLRAKLIFQNSTEKSQPSDIQLSASQKLGIVPQNILMEEENQRYMLALSGIESFKHVEMGDFIISLRSFEGGFEYSSYTGCVSPAYTVLHPKRCLAHGYWKHLFKSEIFKQMISVFNVGIRDGKSIRYDDFAEFILPIPTIREQKSITAFLDRETTRIDALIEKKGRFIELLQEKRQALITQAVTKGLDPNANLKDSGVKWLGQVPEHWEIMVLSRITISRCDGPFGSSIKSEHYTDSGVRIIRLQNIGLSEFKDHDEAFINAEYCRTEIGHRHDVIAGDLLMAGLGDVNNPLGRTCIAPPTIEPAIVKADCYRFRIDEKKASPEFIAYQLSNTAKNECGFISTGSTRERINLGLAAARVIVVPPSLEEQKQIEKYVREYNAKVSCIIEKAQQSIELLKERRTALITAAVTGQIDLRDSATGEEEIL